MTKTIHSALWTRYNAIRKVQRLKAGEIREHMIKTAEEIKRKLENKGK